MGACKNQMMREQDQFWIALHNTARNSDNLEEFFNLAEELFFICKTSGTLHEVMSKHIDNVSYVVEINDRQLYEDLLRDHWYAYEEEQSQKHKPITYEMEN
tara:strand:+ start:628 stop:930 length:303 start_codon:yes stop_codon:yes gene_type:complete